MDNNNKFLLISNYIKETNSDLRKNFGTEEFSFYFYGLVKMTKPTTILELGTGYGGVAFLSALACQENQKGKIITVDDGRIGINYNHHDLIYKKVKEFGIENFIDYRKDSINLFNLHQLNDVESVDIIFNDIDSGPEAVYGLLAWTLPRVKNQCTIFIDKGNFWPTKVTIKNIVRLFNQGKFPDEFLNLFKDRAQLIDITSKFEFFYDFIEKDTMHSQDSVAVIKIKKYDNS